jgi:hypothetical protein
MVSFLFSILSCSYIYIKFSKLVSIFVCDANMMFYIWNFDLISQMVDFSYDVYKFCFDFLKICSGSLSICIFAPCFL